jgi:hypothetical protein
MILLLEGEMMKLCLYHFLFCYTICFKTVLFLTFEAHGGLKSLAGEIYLMYLDSIDRH